MSWPATTAIGEDDVLDLLEAAARTALVQEADQRVGRYRFAHALVQQTLYLGLSPTRRTRAHARVAAAMETLGGREPGELAYHYLAGIDVRHNRTSDPPCPSRRSTGVGRLGPQRGRPLVFRSAQRATPSP